MSIRYQISTWSSGTAMKAFEFTERKRLDAALSELWRQIYDMLKGDGALDTKRAWRLKHEFDQYADKLEREGLKRGRYRSDTFYLYDGDKMNWHVDFRQERF